jgi:hypothetical protein
VQRFLVATALSIALGPAVPSAGNAQGIEFGGDTGFIAPTGNWADRTGLGVPLLLRVEVDLGVVVATGRVGIIPHFPTSVLDADLNTTEVPFLAGVKYSLAGPLYGALELGIVNITFTDARNFFGSQTEISHSSVEIGGTIGVGWELPLLDFRLSLFSPSFNNFMGLMATVGYDFVSL